MANPTLVNHEVDATPGGANPYTHTFVHTPTPGNILAVAVIVDAGVAVTLTSVKDNNGNTIPVLVSDTTAGNFDLDAIAAYVVPTPAPTGLSVTFNVGGLAPAFFVQEWNPGSGVGGVVLATDSGHNANHATGLSAQTATDNYNVVSSQWGLLLQCGSVGASGTNVTSTPVASWTNSDVDTDPNSSTAGAFSYRPTSGSAALAAGTYAAGYTFDAGVGHIVVTYVSCAVALIVTPVSHDTRTRFRLQSPATWHDSPLRFSLGIGQYARPVSDVSIGAWTDQGGGTTNLWSTADEVAPSTADYVQSEPLSTLTDTLIWNLNPLTDPGGTNGFRLDVECDRDVVTPATVDLAITLQASTVDCATRTFSALSSDWTVASFVLTAAEVTAFRSNGGFAAPSVKFVATQSA